MRNSWKIATPPKLIPPVVNDARARLQLEELARILYRAFKSLHSSTESGLQNQKESQ